MTAIEYWLQAAAWVFLLMLVGGLAGAAVTKYREDR